MPLQEQNFWEWFSNNNFKYLELENLTEVERDVLLEELLKQLHYYSEALFFQISDNELIISAEGNTQHFNEVKKLVKEAPDFRDWKIFAFKPAAGNDFEINYEGLKLKPEDLWFLPLENDNDFNKLGLRVYIDNYDLNKEIQYLSAIFQVLDALLGEQSSAEDIQYVEVENMIPNPEKHGLINFVDLTDFIIWRKSKNNSQ